MERRALNRVPEDGSVLTQVRVLRNQCGAALELLPREEGRCLRAHAGSPGLLDTDMQARIRACSAEQFLGILAVRSIDNRLDGWRFARRAIRRLEYPPALVGRPVKGPWPRRMREL